MSRINQTQFAQLFTVGEIIPSGGPRAMLKILKIEPDGIRYQSVKNSTRSWVGFEYLAVIVDGFKRINPNKIQPTIQAVLLDAGLPENKSTENYVYGIARSFIDRTNQIYARPRAPALPMFTTDEAIPSTSSGFMLSATSRRAIETRGVEIAKAYFIGKGFKVEEKGKPYDLHCKKDKETVLVEVKATQGNAEQIILTKNEVELSRTRSIDMQLAIITNITLDVFGRASGGQLRIISPWLVDDRWLTPLAFQYDLSKHR